MTDEPTVKSGADVTDLTIRATDGVRDVTTSRRRVEERLEDLRRAVHDRTGFDLKKRPWTLPLVAAALGFSFALLMRRGRR
jgi:hypothetical protein